MEYSFSRLRADVNSWINEKEMTNGYKSTNNNEIYPRVYKSNNVIKRMVLDDIKYDIPDDIDKFLL